MELFQITVKNAREIAAELNISGRSKMNKSELVDAINATGAEVDYERDADGRAIFFVKKETGAVETPASDHNPDTAGQVAAVDLSVLSILTDIKPQRVYSVPATPERKDRTVTFERTEPGRALAEMYTNEAGITRSVPAVKNGKVWELVDHRNGVMFVVKARSFGKLAKRWAKKVGVWADDIRVIREY